MNDEKNELEYYDDDELLDAEENDEETEDPKKDRVIQNPFVFLLLCLLMFSLPVLWFFGVGNPVNADEILVGEIV